MRTQIRVARRPSTGEFALIFVETSPVLLPRIKRILPISGLDFYMLSENARDLTKEEKEVWSKREDQKVISSN